MGEAMDSPLFNPAILGRMKNTRALGENIRYHRRQRRWPLVLLASLSGVTKQTIGRLERDEVRNPDPDVIERLAKQFDVTVEELWGETNDPLPIVDSADRQMFVNQHGSVLAGVLYMRGAMARRFTADREAGGAYVFLRRDAWDRPITEATTVVAQHGDRRLVGPWGELRASYGLSDAAILAVMERVLLPSDLTI